MNRILAPCRVVLGQGDLVPGAAGDVVEARPTHAPARQGLELVEADDGGQLIGTEQRVTPSA